jgi:hypothetical protein
MIAMHNAVRAMKRVGIFIRFSWFFDSRAARKIDGSPPSNFLLDYHSIKENVKTISWANIIDKVPVIALTDIQSDSA